MILNHGLARETKKLLKKVHTPGVLYNCCAVESYMNVHGIYYADIRHAMKECEVLAAQQHMVSELMQYLVMGMDTDNRKLTLNIIVGDFPLIEIEKLYLHG